MRLIKGRVAPAEHPTWLAISRDLALGPATAEDIAHETRLSVSTVRRWLKRANAAGLVRIASGERTRGAVRNIWELGGAPNAIVRPLTKRELTRRWRERNPQYAPRRKVLRAASWRRHKDRINAARRAAYAKRRGGQHDQAAQR